MIELILATDLKDHFAIVNEAKEKVSQNLFDPINKAEDRLLVAKVS